MCYNLKTSIIAFCIGIISSIFLLLKNNNLKTIGVFTVVITMVQFIEAFIYYFKDKYYKNFIKTLSIILSFQALSFILSYYYFNKEINYLWFLLYFIIFTSVIFLTVSKNFKTPDNYKCMNWKFLELNKYISYLLITMYFTLFIYMFSHKSNEIKLYALVLFITFIYSYFFSNHKNSPSLWCLTSALSTPIYILINKLLIK